MASACPSCDICQLRNISKPAVKWCSECEESICSDCYEHHSLAKATRNHQTISITDYQNLPSAALNIKHYCENHDEKLEFYCPIHTEACCVKCIEVSHHDCREIKPLREAIKDVKSSAVVHEHENALSELREMCKKIKEDKVKNLTDIDQQTLHLKEEIQNWRRQVDLHLDALEKDIMSSLESKKSNCKDRIYKFTSLLDDNITRIESSLDNITKYKQHASELQTFLGLSAIEKAIEAGREFLKSRELTLDLQNFELHLEVAPAFENIITGVTSLGFIMTEKKKSSIQVNLKSDKQAEVQQPIQTLEIYDINKVILTKNVDFTITENASANGICITGCEILYNGNILLANQLGKELLMFTKQGKFEETVELAFGPWDICYINNEKIAVSSSKFKLICIYSMEFRKMVNQTTTTDSSLGLQFHNGKIFCRVASLGIQIFNSTLELVSCIRFPSSSTSHIALSASHIYYSERNKNCVFCRDMNGKEIWRVSNSFTKEIFGISCTIDGFVFTADNRGNTVSLISNNGLKTKPLLEDKDGLNKPRCIKFRQFRHQSNKLLVCNKNDGQVFLYNVKMF